MMNGIQIERSTKEKKRLCNKCKAEIDRDYLKTHHYVCPYCKNLLRIHAKQRILLLADQGRFEEWEKHLMLTDPAADIEYTNKLKETTLKHKLNEAVMIGKLKISGIQAAVGVMDSRFMMGSMGYAVGEKITRLFERALRQRLPVILVCCSGGARMQEGIISLMQMEKTSMAVKNFHQAGLLYISVLTNPTMGGVTASFAMLADIIIAEPDAMIGFAGPRVIEQTTGKKLPDGFQKAEFQLEHGFVDDVVPREQIKEYLSQILYYHQKVKHNFLLPRVPKKKHFQTNSNRYRAALSAWEHVKIARMKERPTSLDYIESLFHNFIELHGDRFFGDDRAVIGGIASFHDVPVTIIAQQKGKSSLEEAMYRNYGMPSPEGYRKALRLMKEAEKFQRPILCFVDTLGAFCGAGAEQRGQGEAIARMLAEMSSLTVPVLSIIISEGGSGGALAFGVGNEVWMLENAVYSVLTPEGYAAILWGNSEKAPEAAARMKLTAKELLDLNIIEKVILEPEPVTKKNMMAVCLQLEIEIISFLNKYGSKSSSFLLKSRYMRFRKF